jgi:hypothetical protein
LPQDRSETTYFNTKKIQKIKIGFGKEKETLGFETAKFSLPLQ